MLKAVFFAVSILSLALPVRAGEPLLQPSGEIDLELARTLIEQGEALRELAEYEYRAGAPECYERFLVNRCLDKLHQQRLERIRAARALEMSGREMELANKRREVAERGLPQHFAEPDPSVAIPAALPIPADDTSTEQAETIRQQREAQLQRARAAEQAERTDRDAQRAAERAKAQARAAERAREAEQDRQRYEQRLRRQQDDN